MSRRKTTLVKDARGSLLKGESSPPIVDYSRMTPEEIGDHLLDDDNLVRFVDVQYAGLPREEWNWAEIARRIWSLSGKKWLMRPETIQSIYEQQGRADA